jgi:hypothetical protein
MLRPQPVLAWLIPVCSIAALPAACISSGTTPLPTNLDASLPEDAGGLDAAVGPSNDAAADQSSPGDATTPGDGATPGDAATDAPSADAAWSSGPTLPVARIQSFSAAPGNGFVYAADGYVDETACSAGTADGRVFYAKQNADGSLGAWTETTVGPSEFMRSIPGHADANGFIYVAGGAINSPTWDGNVWFAKPAADGSIASWTEATNAISTWVGSAPAMAVSNGVLFVGGGFNAFAAPQNSTNLFMSTLDTTTGQPGPWTQLAPLPEAPSNPQLAISAAGYAYFLQGANTDVYVAKLDALVASGGDAGADAGDAGSVWTLGPALPATPSLPDVFIVGSTLYVALGNGAAIYASALQTDGSLGAWSIFAQTPTFNAGYQGIVSNGFYYVLGDDDCSAATAKAEATYYLPLP